MNAAQLLAALHATTTADAAAAMHDAITAAQDAEERAEYAAAIGGGEPS